MASWNGSSLTPSRPAPPVPGGSSNGLRPLLTSAHSSSTLSNGSNGSLTRGMNNINLSGGATPTAGSSSGSIYGGASGRTSSLFSHSPSGSTGGAAGSILREGQVSIKEDGIRSMFFSKRWALLRQNALTFHKNREVSDSRPNFHLLVCVRSAHI